MRATSAERARQHVLGGVLGHVVAPAGGVDRTSHRPRGDLEADGLVDEVVDLTRVVDLHVGDPQAGSAHDEDAGVGELAASFWVERGATQDDGGSVPEPGRAGSVGLERREEGVLPVELVRGHRKPDVEPRAAFRKRASFHGAMVVTLNGEEQKVPDGVTVRQLLEHLALTEEPVAVEINRVVVPRAELRDARRGLRRRRRDRSPRRRWLTRRRLPRLVHQPLDLGPRRGRELGGVGPRSNRHGCARADRDPRRIGTGHAARGAG